MVDFNADPAIITFVLPGHQNVIVERWRNGDVVMMTSNTDAVRFSPEEWLAFCRAFPTIQAHVNNY